MVWMNFKYFRKFLNKFFETVDTSQKKWQKNKTKQQIM